MRLLIESPNCNALGGSNAGVGYGWVSHLAERHEVAVVVYSPLFDTGFDGPAPSIPGAEVIRVEPTRARRLGSLIDYARAARAMRDLLIDRVRPDVVHSIEPGGWVGPRALATDRVPYVLGPLNGGTSPATRAFSEAVLRSLPVTPAKAYFSGGPRRVVVTLVNEAVFGVLPSARGMARRAMRSADRILLATGLDPGAIKRRDESKVRRIPLTGFDLDAFQPRTRPARPFTLLYAGRIVPAKGLHLLIEALGASGAALRIAGPVAPEDAWYERHCRERADALGVGARITWLGSLAREELAREYAEADLYAMLSLWEPFGMTYVEAMASGTPVLGLAAGGVIEIVPREVGWLVSPTTPEQAVAECGALLARLEAERDEVAAAGARARAHAEATYAWPRVLEQLEAVYAELV